MAIKIRDIENEITGTELKEQHNKAYFPVDIEMTLPIRLIGNELIDFIIKKRSTRR